jgi:hypothetical protein
MTHALPTFFCLNQVIAYDIQPMSAAYRADDFNSPRQAGPKADAKGAF